METSFMSASSSDPRFLQEIPIDVRPCDRTYWVEEDANEFPLTERGMENHVSEHSPKAAGVRECERN